MQTGVSISKFQKVVVRKLAKEVLRWKINSVNHFLIST